jgi:hypothetical protein
MARLSTGTRCVGIAMRLFNDRRLVFPRACILLWVSCFISGCVPVGRPTAAGGLAPGTAARPRLPAADNTSHGEVELRRMLRDRPAMALYISEGDELWKWSVRQFDGRRVGVKVCWDGTTPASGRWAECTPPRYGENGRIAVADRYPVGSVGGEPLSFGQLWFGFVFEAHNIRNAASCCDLELRAIQGGVSREEWVQQCVRYEYDALVQTREFCETFWLPWLSEKGIREEVAVWQFDLKQDFQEWREANPGYGASADHFGDYYDQAITPMIRVIQHLRNVNRN